MKIADFHCDLLSYLAHAENRTAHDSASRASTAQLQAGGVALQTLAIYTQTGVSSVSDGTKQSEIFLQLPRKYPTIFGTEIHTVVSIENASSFCSEQESLDQGLNRLGGWVEQLKTVAYIGFTWNGENRFGGGIGSGAGLKPDGLSLLRWLDGKKIAVDLSHASDELAEDILNALEKYSLDVRPIASHSNFRGVAPYPRNLPDTIAREVGQRGGLIGLNFVRAFLGGKGVDDFIRQVEHADRLGLLDHLCFGADFFEDHEVPPELSYLKPFFYDGFDTAACYPKVIQLLLKHLSFAAVEKIAFQNLSHFLGLA